MIMDMYKHLDLLFSSHGSPKIYYKWCLKYPKTEMKIQQTKNRERLYFDRN